MVELVTFTAVCPGCKRSNSIRVPAEGYYDYRTMGKLVQDALPGLTPDERELLISGTCSPCWESLWEDDGPDE